MNGLSTPTGIFYSVKDNGVRCVASPCASVHEAKLDSTTARGIADVNLSKTGANSRQIDAALDAMTHGIIIVAGQHNTVHGAGGSMWELVGSEFYTKLVPAPTGAAAGEQCAGFIGTQCQAGLVCDIT